MSENALKPFLRANGSGSIRSSLHGYRSNATPPAPNWTVPRPKIRLRFERGRAQLRLLEPGREQGAVDAVCAALDAGHPTTEADLAEIVAAAGWMAAIGMPSMVA